MCVFWRVVRDVLKYLHEKKNQSEDENEENNDNK